MGEVKMYQIKQPISINAYILSIWYASWALLLLVGYGIYDPLHTIGSYVDCSGSSTVLGFLVYGMHSIIALLWYCFGSAGLWLIGMLFWFSYNALIRSSGTLDIPRCCAWIVVILCWATIAGWYNSDMGYAVIPGGLCGTYVCSMIRHFSDPIIGIAAIMVLLAAALFVLLGSVGIIFLFVHIKAGGKILYRVWSLTVVYSYQMFMRLSFMMYKGICAYGRSLIDEKAFTYAGVMVPDGDYEYQSIVSWLTMQRLQENESFVLKGATVSSVDSNEINQAINDAGDVIKIDNDPVIVNSTVPYQLPPITLFKHGNDDTYDNSVALKKELQNKVQLLEEKLLCFGVKGKVIKVTVGPVVAVFEYQPEIEIKISKIVALEDDLALALQAHSIRIIAPIPGKAVVGFEIAHQARQSVTLSGAMHAIEYSAFNGALPLILGQDTVGDHVIVDLARMPHILVAGSTGAGKSVGLNAMLISLLCAKSPQELRLVLIDPKRLEFGVYADIPHLLFPIVTSPSQVVPVLRWVVRHMEERYAIMAEAGARAIADYNNRVDSNARYPYLVVVIDELADVMMTVGKDAEQLIARIAQMARAAGIHLIVATQRPSVDVITGIIKVNFPSRIAFRVTSRVDSRTILDVGGAEKLLGKGDMLFQDATSATMKRVHGAYVSDQEIMTIVNYIRAQAAPDYINLQSDGDQDSSMGEDDELMQHVIAFIKTVDAVSISLIQRVFKIGYNRSARIINELEVRGLILPQAAGKMRRVVKS